MWRNGVLRCVSCSRNNTSVKNVLFAFRLFCILNIGTCSIGPLCYGAIECPSEHQTLQNMAFGYFETYITQKMILDKSDRRLFSGIDVETLRAYCSSYLEGVTCTKQLLESCPDIKHTHIEEVLANVEGIEELADLCRINSLYEIYAQYMTCFMERGNKSDWCFETKLGNAVTIETLSEPELCSLMKDATECIENNVRQGCGEQASELVHKLVKATVRRSGNCVYKVHHESTAVSTEVNGQTDKPADPGKRDASQVSAGDNNSSSSLHYNTILIFFTVIHMTYIAYSHKTISAS